MKMITEYTPDTVKDDVVSNSKNSNNYNGSKIETNAGTKTTIPEVTFCNLSDDNLDAYTDMKDERSSKKSNTNLNVESAESILSSMDKRRTEIPDGGYGWVVVFSSLMISLIADGISFSFGLLYTDFLVYFGESKSKTAWVGSLFLAVPLLAGPVMSNLVDKYGCRRMTIIGGLVSALGFVLASVSTSIEQLYLTFGVLSGLGLGIGYVTAVVSVAFWFDKNRTFATGIGASGTGIGTFLYAPFTNWLLKEFCGWRGTTLILAGTMLNTCVFGCLMRDPDWLIEENRLENRSQSVTTFSNSSVCLDEIKKLFEDGAPKEKLLDTLVTNCNTEANQQILDSNSKKYKKKFKSETILPTYRSSSPLSDGHEGIRFLRHKSIAENLLSGNLHSRSLGNQVVHATELDNQNMELLPMKSSQTSLPSTVGGNLNAQNFTGDHIKGSRLSLNEPLMSKLNHSSADIGRGFRGNSLDTTLNNNDANSKININYNENDNNNNNNNNNNGENMHNNRNDKKEGNQHFDRKFKRRHDHEFSFKQNHLLRSSHYFNHMRVHRNSINYRAAMLNTHRYRLRASSCPNIYRNSMTTIAKEEKETWYDDFIDLIKSIFDFSLFLDLKFALLNLSTLLLYIWFIIPYFYINEHLLQNGYEEDRSAHLISIIGIFNTIGMIGLGFIGDRPWLNVRKTYAGCLVLCGISVLLMPIFTNNFTMLIVLSIIFGITFASTFSFTPSILVSLVDLDDFTCAYGLVLLVQGVGSLIGPPLAGVMYDITLKWDDSFYAAGIFIVISGVLAYLIDVFEKKEEEELNENDET